MDSVLPEEWRDGTVLARLAAVRDESAAKRAAIEFCRAVRTNWNFTAAEVRFDARPAPTFRIFGASNCPARVSLVQITSADTRVYVGRLGDPKREYVFPHACGAVHPGVYALFQ